jgi:hypothetical protein
MAAASNGRAARLAAFRPAAGISCFLRLPGSAAQAWFRRTEPNVKVDEGKFKVQVEKQQTVAKPVNGFTALSVVCALLLGVAGPPQVRISHLNLPSLFMKRLYNDDAFVPSNRQSPISWCLIPGIIPRILRYQVYFHSS